MTMDDFSSINFSNIFMKSSFSVSVRFNILDYTPVYYRLVDCIDNVVDHINDNGGFTVIGWYKRGGINDISNDESENQVESSEIGFHIVSIYPTNSALLQSPGLKSKQFDMIEPDE